MDRATLSGLIISLILERPTCLACISAKVGETNLRIVQTVENIGRSLRIGSSDTCQSCGSTLGPVYSLLRQR